MDDPLDSLVEATRAGLILRLRAQPRARRNEVLGAGPGGVRIAVRAVPEGGKANVAVLKTLAQWLDVPATSLELASGGRARDKRVLVKGLSAEQLRARLRALLG